MIIPITGKVKKRGKHRGDSRPFRACLTSFPRQDATRRPASQDGRIRKEFAMFSQAECAELQNLITVSRPLLARLQVFLDNASGVKGSKGRDFDYSAPTGSAPQSPEPRGHQIARQILGNRFLGLDAEEKLLGPLPRRDREGLRTLSLYDPRRNRWLGEDETLRLVERMNDHVLGAVRPKLRLLDLYRKRRDLFFGNCITQEPEVNCSERIGRATWCLMRVSPDPVSMSKAFLVQKNLVSQSGRFFPLLVQYCSLALQYKLQGGVLCRDIAVRFPEENTNKDPIVVYWRDGRLMIEGWKGKAFKYVGTCSCVARIC